MPRRRQAAELNLAAEINVTSLVDVAFVLLLIFIITAPVMQGGVEVQIPKAQTESIAAPEGVVVTISRDRRIFIGEAQAEWPEFRQALTDVVAAKQASNIYLHLFMGQLEGFSSEFIGANGLMYCLCSNMPPVHSAGTDSPVAP